LRGCNQGSTLRFRVCVTRSFKAGQPGLRHFGNSRGTSALARKPRLP